MNDFRRDIDLADIMQAGWDFAASAHLRQFVPGTDLPYLKQLSAVAIEILAAHQVNAQPPSIPSIETAKLNGLEPQACIADVIEKIAGA